ncbi:MAG: peptide deformylase [Bacteroidales bacterium]|nr:peptide deformylase [Bacteroidales bacterium]
MKSLFNASPVSGRLRLAALWLAAAIFVGAAFSSCRQSPVMHVYSVANPSEEKLLRTPCEDFTPRELRSRRVARLAKRMIATVTDSTQNGVGIAAPQVGVSKRLIVVCRLDMESEPFIPYINARIDSCFGGIVVGPEGCLSIPDLRGNVPRYESIIVSYWDPDTEERRSETVSGYTARIFQHETDHLEGILYTDRTSDIYPE